jgi:hypothetical protein
MKAKPARLKCLCPQLGVRMVPHEIPWSPRSNNNNRDRNGVFHIFHTKSHKTGRIKIKIFFQILIQHQNTKDNHKSDYTQETNYFGHRDKAHVKVDMGCALSNSVDRIGANAGD